MNKAKQTFFDKVYKNANLVKCACGCGTEMKDKDRYGRDKKFITGHNGRKYEDPTQYKREWNHRNQESRYRLKIERGHKLKGEIIKLLGGKCVDCSIEYTGENACIFQVHHKEPKKKQFIINTRTLVCYSKAKILKEVTKCKLLCANCHFITHNGKY